MESTLRVWLGIILAVTLGSTVHAQYFDECLSSGAEISSDLPPIAEVITVGTTQTVVDVQVGINITHTFMGDLAIDLQSPDSTSVRLHDTNGGDVDDMNLTFSDQGVPNESQPFTCGCAMQPAGPGQLADFAGQNPQGDWTLLIDDTLGGDEGVLNEWCLRLFETGPLLPVQDLTCTSPTDSGLIEATWTNPLVYDSIDVFVDGSFIETISGSSTSWTSSVFTVPSSPTVALIATAAGESSLATSCSATVFPPGSIGPDVIYSDCQGVSQFGEDGGIRAYALGSFTCNIGDANLAWGGTTPLLAMNAYRLNEGRLEQIGMSWVKNGTGAAAGPGCGLPCNGQGGSVLGAGCLDVYGSGFNGSQGILGPRSQVNAFTGAYPGASGSSPSVISKRLQIHEVDLIAGEGIYFIEGVYVAPDDAASGNALNNASYMRVDLSGGSLDMFPAGSMSIGLPAIYAWADHGNGVDDPDTTVQVVEADVPNEGRFFVGAKVTETTPGNWRYEYAVFNLNSHRSAGSLSIPAFMSGVTGIGFHDVDYHSGDPYDNTDWSATFDGDAVTWSSPQTFTENENSNALRFGTMYNFWFDATTPPQAGSLSLGLFRPGPEDSILVPLVVPSSGGPVEPSFQRGDCNNDSVTNIADGIALLSFLFPSGPGSSLSCDDACDANDDGMLDIGDSINLLNALFSGGAIADPVVCGEDPTADGLDCAAYGHCP